MTELRRTPRPTRSRQTSDWAAEVSSSYALAGFLALVFTGFTLLVMGPLIAIDGYFNIRVPPHAWLPVLHVLDRIGQRGLCLPFLVVLSLWIGRQARSWRPIIVVVVAILAQNFVVGVLKLSFGRGEPATGNPDFFVGGLAYPSGHTSNIVMVYGMMPYILLTYGVGYERISRVLQWLVVVLSLVMCSVSLTEEWHWFGDLVGGLLIGGMMLTLTHGVDHAVPRDIFDDGIVAGLKRIPVAVLTAGRNTG